MLFESRLADDRVEQGEIIASRELKQPLDAGDLTVMTAYYSLNSGEGQLLLGFVGALDRPLRQWGYGIVEINNSNAFGVDDSDA